MLESCLKEKARGTPTIFGQIGMKWLIISIIIPLSSCIPSHLPTPSPEGGLNTTGLFLVSASDQNSSLNPSDAKQGNIPSDETIIAAAIGSTAGAVLIIGGTVVLVKHFKKTDPWQKTISDLTGESHRPQKVSNLADIVLPKGKRAFVVVDAALALSLNLADSGLCHIQTNKQGSEIVFQAIGANGQGNLLVAQSMDDLVDGTFAPSLVKPANDPRGEFIGKGGEAQVFKYQGGQSPGTDVIRSARNTENDRLDIAATLRAQKVPGAVRIKGMLDLGSDGIGVIMERLEPLTIPKDSKQFNSLAIKLLGIIKDLQEKQIIHGDISPNNIMQRANGDPVLIDFGMHPKSTPNFSEGRNDRAAMARVLKSLYINKDSSSESDDFKTIIREFADYFRPKIGNDSRGILLTLGGMFYPAFKAITHRINAVDNLDEIANQTYEVDSRIKAEIFGYRQILDAMKNIDKLADDELDTRINALLDKAPGRISDIVESALRKKTKNSYTKMQAKICLAGYEVFKEGPDGGVHPQFEFVVDTLMKHQNSALYDHFSKLETPNAEIDNVIADLRKMHIR